MLKKLFDALHESLETSSAGEIKSACELIIQVQGMDNGQRDTIRAAYRSGPLYDGDVPSKAARDELLQGGFIAKVVVKGEDGFNACTYKGMWAYKLIEAGA